MQASGQSSWTIIDGSYRSGRGYNPVPRQMGQTGLALIKSSIKQPQPTVVSLLTTKFLVVQVHL